MPCFLSRLVSAAVILIALLCATAATANSIASPIVLGPYAIQIQRLEWTAASDWWWSHDTERLLRVKYQVTRSSDGQPVDNGLVAHNLQIRAYSPYHQAHWSIVYGRDDGTALIPDLDPTQQRYRFDFILRDPGATPLQLGEARNNVEFDGLPVDPSRPGPQAVARRYFTAFGQICRITGIMVRPPAHGDQGQTAIDVAIEPSPDYADVRTIIEDRGTLTDAAGSPIGDRQDASVAAGANHWLLTFSGTPPAGASSLNLRFTIDESTGETDPSVLYHASASIASSEILPVKPQNAAPTLATGASGNLIVRLDRLHVWSDGSAAAQVWLSSAGAPRGEWALDRVIGIWPGGIERPLATQDQQHWLLSGVPAPAAESGYGIYVDPPRQLSGTQPQKLAITAHAVQRQERDVSFSNIALPPSGKTLALQVRPDDGDSAMPRLVAVSSAPGGLAVSAEYTADSQTAVELKVTAAVDDRGLWLLPRSESVVTPAPVVASGKPAGDATFLLHPPSGQAASFSMVLHVIFTRRLGAPRTVILNGIDSLASTN